MSTQLRSLILCSAIVVALTACKSGTYVDLTIEQGSAPAGQVASIDVQLTLGSATATTSLSEASGPVAFPTDVLLEIRNGSGALGIVAIAKNSAGLELVRGTGTATVKRDATAKATVTLGQVVLVDMAQGDRPTGDLPPADLVGTTPDDLPGSTLVLSTTTTTFGSVQLGLTGTSSTIQVQNGGAGSTGTITLTTSGAPFGITDDACTGNALAASETCTFRATFMPTVAITSTGTITITSADAGTATVDLSGTGLQPGDLQLDKHSKNFGALAVNATSGAETFTLSNSGGVESGTVTAMLEGASSSSYMMSTDNCTGTKVPASGSCTIDVVFNPKSLGAKDGVTLTVSDSASGDSATLTGTGVTAGALAFSGDPAFGVVDVSGNLQRDFTITNTGGTSIGPLIVSSSNNTEFTAAMTGTTCAGMTLIASGTCTQRVTFAPGAYGAKSTNLTVGPSGGVGQVVQALGGTGRDQVTMNLTFAGTGSGSVAMPSSGSVSGTAQNCTTTCSKAYYRTSATTAVALAATPTATATTTWSIGSCSGNNCSVLLDASPKPVTVTFTAAQYTLTMNMAQFPSGSGAGGSVTFAGNTCNTASSCTTRSVGVDSGTAVTVTVTPDGSSEFVRFASAGANSCPTTLGPTAPSCSFNVSGNSTIDIFFRPKKNFVFVTSGTFSATSLNASATATPDLSPADTICQTAAANAKLTGGSNYIAWLSATGGGNGNAITRLGAFSGWIRVDGKPFGNTPTNITGSDAPSPAGQIFYPILLDENGSAGGGDYVATGTVQGSAIASLTCNDWKGSGSGSAYYGLRQSTTAGWEYAAANSGCTSATMVRLYCFEKRFNVDVTPPVPTQRRVAFLSEGMWTPNGLANANTICNTEGRALPGMSTSNNFVALLSTSTTPATDPSRVTAAGANWYRLDNVAVAASPAAFIAGTWDTTLNRTPTQYIRNFLVWTGSQSPGQVSNGSYVACGNNAWDAGGNGTGGIANNQIYFWTNSSSACTNAYRLYCLQNN